MKAEKFFYKDDKWYHFKVEIDPKTYKFDMYIDDVKLDDAISMKVEKIDQLGVGIFYGND